MKQILPIEYKDLGIISYQDALAIQTTYFEELISAKRMGLQKPGQLLFCEHTPVLTIGKSGKDTNLLIPKELLLEKGADLYEANRGGDITFHGPGQIIGYPILDLELYPMGLKEYVHRLEEVIIRFLSLYSIEAGRMPSATGVWIEPDNEKKARKICAIGIKSGRYVTMHGFALNINTDLTWFTLINPCGFTDKGVTSLEKETGQKHDMLLINKQLSRVFLEMFS